MEAMPRPVLGNLTSIALEESFFLFIFFLFTGLTALIILVSGLRTTGAGWSLPTLPSCGFLMQLRIRLWRPLSTSKLLLVSPTKLYFTFLALNGGLKSHVLATALSPCRKCQDGKGWAEAGRNEDALQCGTLGNRPAF